MLGQKAGRRAGAGAGAGARWECGKQAGAYGASGNGKSAHGAQQVGWGARGAGAWLVRTWACWLSCGLCTRCTQPVLTQFRLSTVLESIFGENFFEKNNIIIIK